MTDERFSYVVETYFRKRGTHPVTLMFKNSQVDDKFLIKLDKRVHEEFDDDPAIKLIKTKIVEGDYWSGLLLEFDEDEYYHIDSDNWSIDDENLSSKLMEIYDDFDEFTTRVTGLSTGRSVYCVASLESLGQNYFKTEDDVFTGPSI